MIILLRKKSLWVIIGLIAALTLFWGGYWGNMAQSQQSEEPAVTIPITAEESQSVQQNVEQNNVSALQLADGEDNVSKSPSETELYKSNDQQVIPEANQETMEEAIQTMPIQPQDNSINTISDEIIEMRSDRNRNRDMQMESLKQLAADASTTASVKEEAERKMIAISDEKFLELQSENLLKTKGYKNTLVMIDFNNAKVYVGDTLEETDYIKIGDLVHKSTDFSLEEIIIIPK